MPKPTKSLLAIVAAIAAALAMSGCVLIESQSSAQLDGIGDVQITTTACASDTDSNATPARPACQGAGKGGNGNNDTSDQQTQLLLAYRIPTGVTPPDTITTIDPGGGSAFTFSPSPSYVSQLNSALPPGAGRKWAGYISTTQNYTEVGGSQEYFVVSPHFKLGQGSDGSAVPGSVHLPRRGRRARRRRDACRRPRRSSAAARSRHRQRQRAGTSAPTVPSPATIATRRLPADPGPRHPRRPRDPVGRAGQGRAGQVPARLRRRRQSGADLRPQRQHRHSGRRGDPEHPGDHPRRRGHAAAGDHPRSGGHPAGALQRHPDRDPARRRDSLQHPRRAGHPDHGALQRLRADDHRNPRRRRPDRHQRA